MNEGLGLPTRAFLATLKFLDQQFPETTALLVAKNASTDTTAGDAWYEYVKFYRERNGELEWEVIKEIRHDFFINGGHQRVCVPVGFITNLASIPRVLWGIYPPHGTYAIPAIIHDYCTGTRLYPFKVCDDMFYKAMKDWHPPTPWRTRMIFYYSVRGFGERLVYSKHTQESLEWERRYAGYCRPEIAAKLGREVCRYAKEGFCDIAGNDNGLE